MYYYTLCQSLFHQMSHDLTTGQCCRHDSTITKIIVIIVLSVTMLVTILTILGTVESYNLVGKPCQNFIFCLVSGLGMTISILCQIITFLVVDGMFMYVVRNDLLNYKNMISVSLIHITLSLALVPLVGRVNMFGFTFCNFNLVGTYFECALGGSINLVIIGTIILAINLILSVPILINSLCNNFE